MNFLDEITNLIQKEYSDFQDTTQEVEKLCVIDEDKKTFLEECSNSTILDFIDNVKKIDINKTFLYKLEPIFKVRKDFFDSKVELYLKTLTQASDILLLNQELNKINQSLSQIKEKSGEEYKSLYQRGEFIVSNSRPMIQEYNNICSNSLFKKPLTIDDFAERFFFSSGKDLIFKLTSIVNFAKTSATFENVLKESNYFSFFTSLQEFLISILNFSDLYNIIPPSTHEIIQNLFSQTNLKSINIFLTKWQDFIELEEKNNFSVLLSSALSKGKKVFANLLNKSLTSTSNPKNFNQNIQDGHVNTFIESGNHFKFLIKDFQLPKSQKITDENINNYIDFIKSETKENAINNYILFCDKNNTIFKYEHILPNDMSSHIYLGYDYIPETNLVACHTSSLYHEMDLSRKTIPELYGLGAFESMILDYATISISENINPKYILCFDYYTDFEFVLAYKSNLPLIVIDTKQYKQQTNKALAINVIKIHKNIDAYLICSNDEIEKINKIRLENAKAESKFSQMNPKRVSIFEGLSQRAKISNKSTAMKLIQQNPEVFKDLSNTLKNDAEIVKYVLSRPENSHLYQYVGSQLRLDRNFIMSLLIINPLLYFELEEEYKNDKQFIIIVLSKFPHLHKKIKNPIKDDPYILAAILKENPYLFSELADNLKLNKIVLQGLIHYCELHGFDVLYEQAKLLPDIIPIIYKLSPQTTFIFLQKFPNLISNCPQEIISNTTLMKNLIIRNPKILTQPWVNDAIKEDVDFILPLVMKSPELINDVGVNIQNILKNQNLNQYLKTNIHKVKDNLENEFNIQVQKLEEMEDYDKDTLLQTYKLSSPVLRQFVLDSKKTNNNFLKEDISADVLKQPNLAKYITLLDEIYKNNSYKNVDINIDSLDKELHAFDSGTPDDFSGDSDNLPDDTSDDFPDDIFDEND